MGLDENKRISVKECSDLKDDQENDTHTKNERIDETINKIKNRKKNSINSSSPFYSFK